MCNGCMPSQFPISNPCPFERNNGVGCGALYRGFAQNGFSIWCIFGIKTIHPCGGYSICCLLPSCDSATMTNFEQITKFGLWQNTSSKSSIFINCFQWGCFVWIVVNAFIAHNPFQMQSMDKKHNGHAWCKSITIHIKILFGLSLRKGHCLGHLRCVQDDHEFFLHYASCNETFWCDECIHIHVVG